MNFIIIISDSLRRDFLGCYGNKWISTPYFANFAKQSIVFDRAYTASFLAVPHRRDILTGNFTFTYTGWAPIRSIRHRLAKIAEEEYPSAILWFLFVQPGRSVTCIAEGIAEEAEERGINLRIVKGDETILGYIHTTLGQLHFKMKQRGIMYSRWVKRYPHTFYLGGTISPTATPETRRKGQWIDTNYAGSDINSVEDLYPFFKDIFSTDKYVWIYAAGVAIFSPFNNPLRFGRAILE